jgi:hypothetical protein
MVVLEKIGTMMMMMIMMEIAEVEVEAARKIMEIIEGQGQIEYIQ